MSGRQPQQLPSSLHCVLRLLGGASSPSDEDEATTFGHPGNGRVGGHLLDFYEPAGSGFGNDRRTLNVDRGSTARGVWAGVPAKEEGRRSHWYDHIVEQEAFFRSIGFGRDRGRDRMSAPQPSVVEGPGEEVLVRFTPLDSGPGPGDQGFGSRTLLPPLVIRRDVSSSSGLVDPRDVAKGQDGNPDQSKKWRWSNVRAAPRIGFGVPRPEVRHMVVQIDPPPQPTLKKPHNIKQQRRNRREREMYDPLREWTVIWGRNPFRHPYLDVSVAEYFPGRREVACGPYLYIDQTSHIGHLWIDESSVKEEPAVRSSAVPSIVVSSPSSNGALVVNAGHGPVLNHSASVEVNSVEVCLPILRTILW